MSDRLDDARNASLRARDLAQQLLTFARGGAPIKKAASIASLIEETVSFSLRGSQSRSVIAIAPNLWSTEFDPGQISQVIANLVVNAEQAMPDGGTLHVDCDNFPCAPETAPSIPDLVPGDYIRIRVRDEGVGIPEQCLKRIFDPYFTTKPRATVSVSRPRTRLLRIITASSRSNRRRIAAPPSPSICLLPGKRPCRSRRRRPRTNRSTAPAASSSWTTRKRIRALVEFALSRFGYEVVGAETASQGIELYREALICGQRFDLVILDLTLPGGIGGKEALKALIEIDPMVTAIVSSGYAMDATHVPLRRPGFPWCHCEALRGGRAGTNGARRYLRKPTRLRIPGRATIDVG